MAADLIGYAINSHGGAFFPGFTLTAALTGFIPGLLLSKRRKVLQWWQVGLTVLITDLIAGVFLNTVWLTIMFGQGFFVLLPARLLARLVTLPIYTLAVFLVAQAYQSYLRGRE